MMTSFDQFDAGPTRTFHVVVGLGYGDEGKGATVDHLMREHGTGLVARFNGGPQCGHRVVTSDGRSHIFAQIGAGSLLRGVHTHLGPATVVDPLALAREAEALEKADVSEVASRLSIDPRCVVVTPFHAALNRLREGLRGEARHGSCGLGIAEARLDAERAGARRDARNGVPVVRVADVMAPQRLRNLLRVLRLSRLDLAEQLLQGHTPTPETDRILAELRDAGHESLLAAAYHAVLDGGRVRIEGAAGVVPGPGSAVVLEGAQGVLLDRQHGFWPHVTPSRTTFADAEALAAELDAQAHIVRVGVLRALSTRHGAGPLVTEDPALAVAHDDEHNTLHPWQGPLRVGWFDAVAARYALAVCGGVDRLALTCLDRLDGLAEVRICTAYEPPETIDEAVVPALVMAEQGGRRVVRDLVVRPKATDAQREALTRFLARCRPVYAVLPGWARAAERGDAASGVAAAPRQLSPEAARFVRRIEALLPEGVQVDSVAVGPCHEDRVTWGRPL